jgi:Fe2+ transport system protein B
LLNGCSFSRQLPSFGASPKGPVLMISINRDVIALMRIFTSCLTAGFLIFFISSLSGEDLIKNNSTIEQLDAILSEITVELEGGIEKRIKQLGEVPAISPYKQFYCAEFAKEIHEISYLTEKQKILFDSYNVRDFENKSKRLVTYSETGNMQSLLNELEIVKRELKNSANLVDKRRKKLLRQRTAYIILFFVLWITIYFYYSRGLIRR